MNCLNQAITEERIHQVRLLLSLNVDSEGRDKKDLNRTPLIKAALLPNEESACKISKILLRAKVDVNSVDNDKRSSLHHSCSCGLSNLVEILLKEDSIKLNEQDKNGQTPLMLAAQNGHLKAARMIALRLTKFDLDIDLRDSKGYTALLLAIKYKNYNIALDLVRYGNACSSLRDNEKFMNASEWLKKGLSEEKMTMGQLMQRLSNRPKQQLDKADPDEINNGNQSAMESNRVSSAVPLLTVTESVDQDTEIASETEFSMSGITSIKEAAAMSGLLFEPELFRKHTGAISSAVSKAKMASSKIEDKDKFSNLLVQMNITDVPNNERPGTATENASVKSQGSKLGDDLVENNQVKQTRLSASSTKKFKRQGRNSTTGRGKPASARRDLEKEGKLNLGNINIPLTNISYPSIRRNSNMSYVLTDTAPTKDSSKSNFAVINALKQALKDQKKRKITRNSTMLTRPYTAAGTEPNNDKISLTVGLPLRPHTRARVSGYEAVSRSAPSVNKDEALFPSDASMDTAMSASNISEEPYAPNYRLASAIERANRNMRTLFTLYTDSYLWTPQAPKPASLAVQMVGSDKLTVDSELTASVSDLASMAADRSVAAPSEVGNQRSLDSGKVRPAKSRLMSGSATSRASRRSAGLKSAGSGSTVR